MPRTRPGGTVNHLPSASPGVSGRPPSERPNPLPAEANKLAGGAILQLFNTFSAFLGSEARKIKRPFLASGLVAE